MTVGLEQAKKLITRIKVKRKATTTNQTKTASFSKFQKLERVKESSNNKSFLSI